MDDYLPEYLLLDASTDVERCFTSDIQSSSHFSPYHAVGLYNLQLHESGNLLNNIENTGCHYFLYYHSVFCVKIHNELYQGQKLWL
jgi:hypothetical protein